MITSQLEQLQAQLVALQAQQAVTIPSVAPIEQISSNEEIIKLIKAEISPIWEVISQLESRLEAENMKIKHYVVAEQQDIDALVEPLIAVCLATYSTTEEQNVAISSAKLVMEEELNKQLLKAFKFGKKLSKMKSDDKDTAMYAE